MGLRILYFAILFFCVVVYPGAAAEPSKNQSQCQRQCGDEIVPYPFGLEDSYGCFLNPLYMLSCNHSFTPPKLFSGNIPILDISVQNAIAIAYIGTTYTCYDESGLGDWIKYTFDLTGTPFTFMAIGCDTQANLYLKEKQLGPSCVTTCDNSTLIKDRRHTTQQVIGPCSNIGIGCCQTQISKGLKYLKFTLSSFSNHSNLLVSSPCDYAFLTAGPNAKLVNGPEGRLRSQIVLDWAVGDTTCEEHKSICGPNTNCINSNYSSGYSCSCMQGYTGNPFTVEGCQGNGDTKVAVVCSATADTVQGSYVGYMVLLLVGFVKVGYW